MKPKLLCQVLSHTHTHSHTNAHTQTLLLTLYCISIPHPLSISPLIPMMSVKPACLLCHASSQCWIAELESDAARFRVGCRGDGCLRFWWERQVRGAPRPRDRRLYTSGCDGRGRSEGPLDPRNRGEGG